MSVERSFATHLIPHHFFKIVTDLLLCFFYQLDDLLGTFPQNHPFFGQGDLFLSTDQ